MPGIGIHSDSCETCVSSPDRSHPPPSSPRESQPGRARLRRISLPHKKKTALLFSCTRWRTRWRTRGARFGQPVSSAAGREPSRGQGVARPAAARARTPAAAPARPYRREHLGAESCDNGSNPAHRHLAASAPGAGCLGAAPARMSTGAFASTWSKVCAGAPSAIRAGSTGPRRASAARPAGRSRRSGNWAMPARLEGAAVKQSAAPCRLCGECALLEFWSGVTVCEICGHVVIPAARTGAEDSLDERRS